MSVGDLVEREDRPAMVRFEKRPIEDKEASRKEGKVVFKDIDYVLVTPPYSRDCHEQKVDKWLDQVEKNVRNGRTPPEWLDHWKKAYQKWKEGLELPLNGTPVSNWPAITPAQVKTCHMVGILTIEDLALANDEGLRRLGMGGRDLKNKAQAYMKAAKETGPLVMENAALKKEVDQQKGTIDSLIEKMEIMNQRLQALQSQPLTEVSRETIKDAPISASDILGEPDTSELSASERYERKFGKPPHHRMKEETILRKLAE